MRSKVKENAVLMPLFSLPGDYGIGDFKYAKMFADFLNSAKINCWQTLPLNPIGEGNSPYKSECSFAGEILYIDIEDLLFEGLLKPDEIPKNVSTQKVDYSLARKIKIPLLKKAVSRFDKTEKAYNVFCKENAYWLEDYSLLSCLEFDKLSNLPDTLKYRDQNALEKIRQEKAKETEFCKITQFLFFKQFYKFKRYLNKKRIKLIGDMPFYVSPDSTDVWCYPDGFCLNNDLSPKLVAGVPPDVFSATGQKWGNPVYDFSVHQSLNYSWWKKRFLIAKDMYDLLRIDHFRAFAQFYCIDFGSTNAKSGNWVEGPGEEFFIRLNDVFKDFPIIAEDLGGEDDTTVQSLIKKLNIPNMKVLQFAFTGDKENIFLPQNYTENCVAFTGTHDNDTILGWYSTLSRKERVIADCFLPYKGLPINTRMIRAVAESKSFLCVVPFADFLCLGSEARINTPGTIAGNWEWKIKENLLNDILSEDIEELIKRE